MTRIRTIKSVVTFRSASRLTGFNRPEPAGTNDLEVDEDIIEGNDRTVYRPVTVMPGSSRVNGPLALVLTSFVATAALLAKEHERLRAEGRSAVLFVLGCCICLAVRCGPWRRGGRGWQVARDLAESVGLFSASAMIGAVASYPDAAASSGLVDPLLEHGDRLLHFDWVSLYLFTAHHRYLQVAGATAYQSIYLIAAVLLFQFAWTNRRAEAHRFLVCFWMAAAATLVVFRWLPAVGPLAMLWKGAVPYMPQSALYQARLVPLLQQHRLRFVDVEALHGLVSAPSFHAACSMLYILFARRMGRLRVPLVCLSLLMLAATPVEGTHYLVDIIAGVFVAGIAYAAAQLPQVRWLWDRPIKVLSTL